MLSSDNFLNSIRLLNLMLYYKKLTIICVAVMTLAMHDVTCQKLRFGLTFGTYFSNESGNTKVDSILVLTNTGGNSERLFGASFKYVFNERIFSKLGVTYYPVYTDFIIYNFEQSCLFCPIEKGRVVSRNTIEFSPSININLIKLQAFRLGVLGTLSLQFQLKKDAEDTDFNGKHQGVAEVINAIDQAPKPVVPYAGYGVFLEYKRFYLEGKYTFNLTSSNFGNMEVYGKEYQINSNGTFLFLSLTYFFNFKKREAKEGDIGK